MTNRRTFIKAGAAGLLTGSTGIVGAGMVGVAPAHAAQSARSYAGDVSYAATAPDKPWLIAQRPGPPVSIDAHTHWAPPGYLQAKADLGHPDFLDPINADLSRRIEWMDTHGIRTQVLTLGGFRPWEWVTAEQGARISRIANDAAMAAHQAHPDRFLAGIELNCSDPAGSLAELNRVAGKPGLVFVHLPTSLAGHDYAFDDDFAPVLARIQALGLPIFFHPLDGTANWFAGKRLADRASGADPHATGAAARFPGLTNSLGNTLEVAVTMSKLIVSGTLDRYPELVPIMACAGGALPYGGGRLEFRSHAARPIHTYLRRFYYDSLTFWPASLRYLAEMVGTDRIVLGTDNMFAPSPQITEQPHSVIDQAGFSDDERALVLHGNLARLFRL